MPTAREHAEQQRFSPQGGTRQYWCDDAANIGEALAAVLAAAPASWTAAGHTLLLDDKASEAFEIGDDGPYFGVARYKPQEFASLGAGESSFEFDTTGGTAHLSASFLTVAAFGDGADVEDNGNLIGVTQDGVEGVDVVVPAFAFQITKAFDVNDVDETYILILILMTGAVNNDTFTVTTDDGITFDLEAGECLFLGARGGMRNGLVEITFFFAGSLNVDELVIGDITVTDKRGWDYIWVRYRETTTIDGKWLTKQPVHVYLEQVYEDGPFSTLGL